MGPLKCNGTQPSHYCSPTLLICFISRCCCIAKILELKRYFLLSHSQFSGNKIVEEKIQVFGKVWTMCLRRAALYHASVVSIQAGREMKLESNGKQTMKILKVTTLFIYFLHVRITGGSMLVDGAVWMGSLHCEDFGWHLPCVDTAGFGTLKPDFSWNETTFEEPWASLVTLLAYFCFYIHSWHFCILSYTREPLTSNVILIWSAKEHALISTRILTCSNRWNC